MNRRYFLATSLLSSFSFSAFAKGYQALDEEAQLDLPVNPGLLNILKDEDTIFNIGSSYLKVNPAERNLKRLRRKIYAEDGKEELESADEIEKVIRNDFAAGRIIQLNGWILSVTEARQCALFALLYS